MLYPFLTFPSGNSPPNVSRSRNACKCSAVTELWRSEWANVCNAHLKAENHIDHRSYARQGKLEIPTIHEGADARKIDEKFQNGQTQSASWKVEENQIIKRQNALLDKIQTSFGKVYGALTQWKERLNDIDRQQEKSRRRSRGMEI